MDIKGFCTIRKDATTGKGTKNPEWFLGEDCMVMEFDPTGGVLVLDWKGRGLAMFDKEDIYRKFECEVFGDVICPPNMDMFEKAIYSTKVLSRKGGYNILIKNMVVQASLMKGKFDDNFLFQKEKDDIAMRKMAENEKSNKSENK